VLAATLTVPLNEDDWDIWSLANYNAIVGINAAIASKYGVVLPQYPLQPIPFDDIGSWMSYNQQAHYNFTGVLGQAANDLTGYDLTDPAQRESWIWLNFKDLQNACATLGIAP
jgi:hypothetical protein